MFTMKVFAVGEVHERLAVPVPFAERETVADGLKGWHVRPAGTVSPSATEPTKLNVLVRVIVEVRDAPALPLGEVALIVKSPTWTVAGGGGRAGSGGPPPGAQTADVAAGGGLKQQEGVGKEVAGKKNAVACQSIV